MNNQGVQFPLRFDGADYVPKRDDLRLTGQLLRIWIAMVGEKWLTLSEIEDLTGDPPASISAQLRHLRKKRFGSHTVDRRHRSTPAAGLYEYRIIPHRNIKNGNRGKKD